MQQRKSIWLIGLLLCVLIWSLTGCGGDSESDVPAETTPTAAAPADTKPAKIEHPAVSAPTPTARPEPTKIIELAEPATVRQAAQLIDLRQLPRLEDATPAYIEQVGYIAYSASVTAEAAIDFHRRQLIGLGWQEQPDQELRVDNDRQKIAVFAFSQAGFHLKLEVMELIGETVNNIQVTVSNHGNIDVRGLPRHPQAEVISETGPISMVYVTPALPDQAAAFIRQELAALGWQEYWEPMAMPAATPGIQSLHFIKNGIDLSATVFTSDAPQQAGKTSVSYTTYLAGTDLPIFAGAADIQLNNSGYAYKNDFYVNYASPAAFETIFDFYRQQLAALDWQPQGDVLNLSPEQAALVFNRAGEEQSLLLSLERKEQEQTVVTLALVTLAEDEELPTLENPASPAETDEVETGPALSAEALPLPADAESPTFDAESEQIGYTSPSDIKTLVDFYRSELPAQGWQEDETFSAVEENFAFVSFNQGDASLTFTFFNLGLGDPTEVIIDAEGLAWNGATADTGLAAGDETELDDSSVPDEAPGLSLNDWPIPAEAEEVKQDTDELSYLIAWDFAAITDFYRPTYDSLDLSSSCFDDLGDFTSLSCSTSNGTLSVSLHLWQKSDGRTEVTFSFYGLDSASAGQPADSSLSLVEADGLPVPSDLSSTGSEGTDFRKSVYGASDAALDTLVELYRQELPAQGWQEQAAEVSANNASLTFEKEGDILTVELAASNGQTELNLLKKSPAAAAEMGILPPAGQGRLYFANTNAAEVSIAIAGQAIKVSATDPAAQPDDMVHLDLAPGQYDYTLTIPGAGEFRETIKLEPDETWMFAIGPDGAFMLQVY